MVPWIGFCQNTLPAIETRITIVDYLGFAWRCDLRFVKQGNSIYCRIGSDWGIICKAHRFDEGCILELAVTNEKNNDVIYLKYIPRKRVKGEMAMDFDPKMCLQADAHLFNFKGYVLF